MAIRYFLTTNASRPYVAGGFTFSFEPVQNRGGSWLGVLAVDEDSAASALASAALQGVDEISFERFDNLKKKLAGIPTATSASHRPQRVPTPGGAPVRLVEPQAGARGIGNPLIPRPIPTPVIEAVSLQTTDAEPPNEPLLDSPSNKPKKRYTIKPQ